MKSFNVPIIRLTAGLALLLACGAAAGGGTRAQAQTVGRVQIDSLDRLTIKAVETVNVNLSETLLKIVPLKSVGEEGEIKQMIAGLKGVYVKHLEFQNEGAYSESDIAPIRAQLVGPGWSRIVEVTSRREDIKNLEVYLATTGARVDGLVVLAVEPKRLTFVNIVGAVDLEKLRKIEGSFGVPELEIDRDETKAPKKPSAGAPQKKP